MISVLYPLRRVMRVFTLLVPLMAFLTADERFVRSWMSQPGVSFLRHVNRMNRCCVTTQLIMTFVVIVVIVNNMSTGGPQSAFSIQQLS